LYWVVTEIVEITWDEAGKFVGEKKFPALTSDWIEEISSFTKPIS